jgi:2-polyprenyl-3-methyl-5-hydroxy-6-metoxy-1,4-benzoquinol methylase
MSEINLQESFEWERQTHFANYAKIHGYYLALSVLENIEAAERGSLLDMPCGDGYVTGILAPHFKRTVGIDASSQHLEKAKKEYPNITFHHSLIEDFVSSEKFNVITMLHVLEHVIDPVEVLKKAESLLAENGTLIVQVPNAIAVNRKIAVLMGTLKDCEELSPFDINVAGHRRSYTMKTLVEDVKKAGLEIINSGGIFYKMLSTPQMDWFLENGLWKDGWFGWGRVGEEKTKDWKMEFCRACYEYGKTVPEDCNTIYVCAKRS